MRNERRAAPVNPLLMSQLMMCLLTWMRLRNAQELR